MSAMAFAAAATGTDGPHDLLRRLLHCGAASWAAMTSLDRLNEVLERSPLHQWLGCRVESHDTASGSIRVRLPARPELRRSADHEGLHGGIVAALIDLAAGAALMAVKGATSMPTVDLRVDFLLPALPPLVAAATPRRVGRNIGVADVEIFDDQQRLVALGRVVYRMVQI